MQNTNQESEPKTLNEILIMLRQMPEDQRRNYHWKQLWSIFPYEVNQSEKELRKSYLIEFDILNKEPSSVITQLNKLKINDWYPMITKYMDEPITKPPQTRKYFQRLLKIFEDIYFNKNNNNE